MRADTSLELALDISNEPNVVRVVEKGEGYETEVLLQEFESDGSTRTIQLSIRPAPHLKETSIVLYDIYSRNTCDEETVRIGELAVERSVVAPSVELRVAARDPLGNSERLSRATRQPSREGNRERLVVFGDEPVTLTIEAQAGTFATMTKLVAEYRDREGRWHPVVQPRERSSDKSYGASSKVFLKEDAIELRAVMDLSDGTQVATRSQPVSVIPAPVFLICVAKGGSEISSLQGNQPNGESIVTNGGGGGGGGGGNTGDTTSCVFTCRHHPETDGDDVCELSDEIGTRRLALRLLDEGLAQELRVTTADGTCIHRNNPEGSVGTIIVGAFNNSLTDGADSDDWFTWQGQLYAQASAVRTRGWGKDHVIFIGHSHGGAAFAHVVKEDWPWRNELEVELFISLDSTDEGGGIESVGRVPKRVVNFFQTDSFWWFQNGAPIGEADVEYDLSSCLSHTDLDSGFFVQCRSIQAVREVITEVREQYRKEYAPASSAWLVPVVQVMMR